MNIALHDAKSGCDTDSSASSLSLRVRLIDGEEEFDTVRQPWNDLLGRSITDNIFLTWEWLHSWWSNYRQANRRLFLLVAEDHEGRWWGLAPLTIESIRFGNIIPLRVLRFLGDGSEDSDYLDFLLEREHVDEVLAAFWKYLIEQKSSWDVASLYEMPPDSPSPRLLEQWMKRDGIPFRVASIPCSSIALPRDWESYLQTFHPKFRQKIKSCLRSGGEHVRLRQCSNPEELSSDLESLFDLHTRRWHLKGQEGVFAQDKRKRFYRDMTRLMLEKGWLRLVSLEWDKMAVAMRLGFEYKGVLYGLQSGFDPAFAERKVGHMLMALVLKRLIQQGVQAYDFLGGISQAKILWGALERSQRRLFFGKRTVHVWFFLNFPVWAKAVKTNVKKVLPMAVWSLGRKLLPIFLLSCRLMAAPAENLNGAFVYPNPFQPQKGHTSVVFDMLTDSVRIRIYKTTAELVYDRKIDFTDGKVIWDATNYNNQALASGVYVYRITNDSGQKATGKLVVLR